jgi:glycosyltransferase involved in cell wall biosynthesis
MKQGVESLVELARLLQGMAPEVRMVLRGEGDRFDAIRALQSEHRLTNVRFERPVSTQDLPKALASTRVHLVTQATNSAPFAMPSKVINALVCGATVVAMCDADSPVANLATELPGLHIVRPGDLVDMAGKVAEVVQSTEVDDRMAIARAARERFSRERILNMLEAEFLGTS